MDQPDSQPELGEILLRQLMAIKKTYCKMLIPEFCMNNSIFARSPSTWKLMTNLAGVINFLKLFYLLVRPDKEV
jgi:hypothetical protein